MERSSNSAAVLPDKFCFAREPFEYPWRIASVAGETQIGASLADGQKITKSAINPTSERRIALFANTVRSNPT
jgi:hypothetical protein